MGHHFHGEGLMVSNDLHMQNYRHKLQLHLTNPQVCKILRQRKISGNTIKGKDDALLICGRRPQILCEKFTRTIAQTPKKEKRAP
jgi:hypothetical protein